MANEDCPYCIAGYRCPCECDSDCGSKHGMLCPKSEEGKRRLEEFRKKYS